ncbi:TolC family protein [Yeosuana sp.]|uniref:TolC family protein n=1 Tax=Yeosuana sp. TaxID=2529388 RepID=UPI004055167B|tara:strand:+ start:479 stop:1714 length:1236 start_codon:yes stop_codon:yes gene_type:complete
MKYIFFFSLLLVLGTSVYGQEDLDNYLKIAAENSPDLRATFNEYMAAMEKVPQVGTLPDPQAVFGYFIQPAETRVGPQRANFGLSQSFPWFGLLGARADVATDFAKAKYEEFENTKSNLFFEVKTAYYNYYFIEKAIEITKENIEILEVFKRLSLVKIEAGTATVVDELRVELEINDLVNQLELFLDTKDVFRVKFNNLLDVDERTEIIVPDLLWQDNMPLDQLNMLEEIYASNHQLKGIDHKINAFINQEVVAKKEGLPKFNIGLGYTVVGNNPLSTVSDNGKDAFVFPSVGLTIPLYRKKYKALISEARYLQDSEISRKEDKKNTLGTIYENTLKEYKDGHRRIALNLNQSNIAKKVLDLLIITYSTNSKDFEEVLRIERDLLRYELEYEKALTDKNASIAFMNYLIGK